MRASIALAPAFFLLGSTGVAIPPPRYFPLDPGNAWTYVEPDRPASDERKVRVEGVQDGLTVVDFYGTQGFLQDRQAELDIKLPDQGLVSYYRFAEKSFIHHDLFGCDSDRQLDAAATEEVVETPAGVFESCLRLDYGPAQCADGGRISEWWKLEVGLVKWIENSIAGPRVHVLKSFEHESPAQAFRRGDADGDGAIVLSDAVFTLNYLFTGGRAPGCQDAADSNDDGALNIGDPIFLLGYLFLGSATPPAPGPEACGEDPTIDVLPVCDFSACKQGFGT